MQEAEQVIEKSRRFTEEKLKKLEEALSSVDIPNWSLIVNGSYARREASLHSDFDYFILHKGAIAPVDLNQIQDQVRAIVKKTIGKLPSKEGAFDAALEIGTLSKNIGGAKDTNEHITRRILFLTEGMAVNNPGLYAAQRDELIARYVSHEISDHQLGMFLLNDLIRYYRTVCVDFEYKTVESNKAWGIRNIKLVFSRKLLYFSGVLIAAEMAQRTALQKRQIAQELISLPPVERIRKVCRAAADRAIESYATFLAALEEEHVREMLEKVTADRDSHTDEFKRLKNEGHHFSFHLMSALKSTYSESHPIHRALVM